MKPESAPFGIDTSEHEPKKIYQFDKHRIPCIYTKENVYFSTAARLEDVTIYSKTDAITGWSSLETIAIYTKADRFRLHFTFEEPLSQSKSIPLDRIPARQIDVNVDNYVSIKDLDTDASYKTIEELKHWIQTPSLPPMGSLVSFRLRPGVKVRFRMNAYSIGGTFKCALNMLGPIS